MAEKEDANNPQGRPKSPLQIHFYSDNKGWTTIDPNVPMSQQTAAGSWFASQSPNDNSGLQPMHIQSTMGKGPDQPGQRGVIITSNPADRQDRQSPIHALFFDTDRPAGSIPAPPGFIQFPGQIAPEFPMDQEWSPCQPDCPGFSRNIMAAESPTNHMTGNQSITVAGTFNLSGGQGINESSFTVQHTGGHSTSSRPNSPGSNANNLECHSSLAAVAADVERNNNCEVQALESWVTQRPLPQNTFYCKEVDNYGCHLRGMPSGDELTGLQGLDYTAHSASNTCWGQRESFGSTPLTMNSNTGQSAIPQGCACHNHSVVNPAVVNHSLHPKPWQFPQYQIGCSHHPYPMVDLMSLQQPFYPTFGEHHNYPNALCGTCQTNCPSSQAVLPIGQESACFVREQQFDPGLSFGSRTCTNATKSLKPEPQIVYQQQAAQLYMDEAKRIQSKLIDRSCQTNLSSAHPGQVGVKGRPVTNLMTGTAHDKPGRETGKQTSSSLGCCQSKALGNKTVEASQDKVPTSHLNHLHHEDLLHGPPIEKVTYLATTDLNASHDIGAVEQNVQPNERVNMYTTPIVLKHTESCLSDTILTAFVKATSRRVGAEIKRVNQATGNLH